MGKLLENKLEKEKRLLKTAFELFNSQGFSKTSIADIVRDAGVAKGTFYLYFKDKYDIQKKLIADKSASLFQHALDYSHYEEQPTTAKKMIAIIDDLLKQMQKNPLLVRFINKNLTWGVFHQALENPNFIEQSNYMEVLQQIISTDNVEYDNPDIMLYTIVSMVGSTCHSVILDNDPVDLETYKPYLYASIEKIVELHQKPVCPNPLGKEVSFLEK